MILSKDIFNNQSVNVFTDASILNTNHGMVGCAGYCVVIENQVVNQGYKFIENTTNNRAELAAIYMGLEQLYKYKYTHSTLRLFSDSQTSILGLRDRIFKWIKGQRETLIGSDGKPIANQDIIMQCILFILYYELNVCLLHQKGHINFSNNKELQEALCVFKKSNYISDDIDLDIIRKISYANDMVDKYTKVMLKTEYHQQQITYPISFGYQPFDYRSYKSLVKGGIV